MKFVHTYPAHTFQATTMDQTDLGLDSEDTEKNKTDKDHILLELPVLGEW